MVQPRFDLDLEIEGSLKPGHPIHVGLRGRANYATQRASIRLILPEVAAARRSSWERVDVPVGEEVPAELESIRALAAHERFDGRATVIIPEPGYYQLLASVTQQSDDGATDGGETVGTGAGRELWLWIDEHGGKVTDRFDPELFPEGTRRIRGPLGSERKPPKVHLKGTYITCSVYPSDAVVVQSLCTGPVPYPVGSTPPPPTVATASASVTYLDQGTSTTRPLVDAAVAWKVVNTATNAIAATGSGYTDGSGSTPMIDCAGATSERRLELTVYTRNRKAEVKSYIASNADRALVGQYFGSCGGSIPVAAENQQAHLFMNLTKNWDGHTQVFGTSPPTVLRAGLYPISVYGTRYDWNASDVHIEPAWDHIWGEMGVLVAAHEWGHLWQDQYLFQAPASDGLKRIYSGACPNPHPVGSLTNFGCAFAEAFADWYAVLVRESDLPTWRRNMEENRYHLLLCTSNCTDDGSIVQGAIHAFLWDITDPMYTESFDFVQKRPSDVIYAIKACEVAINWTDFKPYTGIDHLIWCMEHRFPYQVRVQTAYGESLMTFFDKRSSSTWPKDARGPMVDGFSDNFRRLWLVDLYSKRTGVGTAPIFRNLLAGEDPSVPRDTTTVPADSTCTPTGTEITCAT